MIGNIERKIDLFGKQFIPLFPFELIISASAKIYIFCAESCSAGLYDKNNWPTFISNLSTGFFVSNASG